jgi:hypothetical protein
MSYNIVLLVRDPMFDNWGEFGVRKTYRVSRGRNTKGVFGYIIQTVQKNTQFSTGEQEYRTSEEIAKFTNRNVLNATGIYSEVFPILNGTTCYGEETEDRGECMDDQFQNGALLRYEEEDGTFYANDDPPTKGTITMIGYNQFFPTDEETVREIVRTTLSRGTMKLQGITWTADLNTPARGLLYNSDFRIGHRASEATHMVNVSWETDGKTNVKSEVATRGGRRRTYRKKKLRNQTRKRRQ